MTPPVPDSPPDRGPAGRRERRLGIVQWLALGIGLALFIITIYFVDLGEAAAMARRLGVALPIALAISGAWHLARTWAWAWCFPEPRRVGFVRLARVRLAAEAFSYLTLRGIAGEPLKVVLLADSVDAREATAAVALERIAYSIGTVLIVGLGALLAILTLPLTHGWFRVFRAFAIGAGVIAVFAALVLAGRGTYLQSFMRWIDRRAGSSVTDGRVGRFIASVERLMLELVRQHPKRLAVLGISTVASFACMVLEAWVVMRAAGSSVTLLGAWAVETFTRVASFASSPIPANLGALEASSLAAAAAIGATGGSALAIARRLRGLFWAGLGLLIYPRQPAAGGRKDARQSRAQRGRTNTLLYMPHADDVAVPAWIRLAGLPVAERVVRAALRAGYARVVVLAPRTAPELRRRLDRLFRAIRGEIIVVGTEREWRQTVLSLPDAFTVVGAGTVVSPALFESAASIEPGPDEVCDAPAGPAWRESGVLRAGRLAAADVRTLAARLAAWRGGGAPLPSGEEVAMGRARLALRLVEPADVESAERTLRRSIYKDTDATLARFNRRLSLPISIALIRTPLTPNQLSLVLVAMGFYAAWLFSLGSYWAGVAGAFLSLAASVLDGCDGELARLKYQESALGCWIETIGDYSYYVAIFVGLTVGAVRLTGLEAFYWLGGLALAGALVTFAILIYLRNRITAGRPERLHAIARQRFTSEPTWLSRLIWRISFVATRSAMPYGIMALALVHALPLVVVLAAVGANVYWISLVTKLSDLLTKDDDLAPASR